MSRQKAYNQFINSEAWKLNLRRMIARKFARPPFLNPYYDQSDPKLWPEEVNIVEQVLNASEGDDLVQTRYYIESDDTYAIGWYWSTHPKYPRQWDGPVTRLISRGVLRSVTCAGGYTRMVFTEAALAVLKA